MLSKILHNTSHPRELKEIYRFKSDNPSDPKNYIKICVRNNGEIVAFYLEKLILSSKSRVVKKSILHWLNSKFGGQKNQKRWTLTKQQLNNFLLEPMTELAISEFSE